MARPTVTTEGRSKPQGVRKPAFSTSEIRRTQLPGLSFTRVRNLRRELGQKIKPRDVIQLPPTEAYFEERYVRWEAIHGGTRPEFVVYDYLERTRKFTPGVDFIFQASKQGGRKTIGGAVVDFELPRLKLLFRVQGERFHLGTDVIARDTLSKLTLMNTTKDTVVDIWPDQLMRATSHVMESALRGITLREPRGW